MTVLGLLDGLAGAAAGRPVRLRVAVARELVFVRAPRARFVIGRVDVAGLGLERVDVRAQDVRVVPGIPPRVRASAIEVLVTVHQDAIDAWSAAAGIPVRLVLRDGAVVARTGIAGIRLGEVEIGVEIAEGLLRLVPRRLAVLGVQAAAPLPMALPLPLPPLPRSARLTSLTASEGSLRVGIAVERIDEPVTPARLAWLAERLLGRPGVAPAPRPTSTHRAGDRGRVHGHPDGSLVTR